MQDKVVKFGKPVLMLAHTREDLDEKAMEMKTAVPIKGALKNQGVEAYFSTVVATKKVSVKELEPFANAMLNITEEDMLLGFKHVFQTRLTQKTVGERIRSPMGLFTREEIPTPTNRRSSWPTPSPPMVVLRASCSISTSMIRNTARPSTSLTSRERTSS
jgi:hypothetical protein